MLEKARLHLIIFAFAESSTSKNYNILLQVREITREKKKGRAHKNDGTHNGVLIFFQAYAKHSGPAFGIRDRHASIPA